MLIKDVISLHLGFCGGYAAKYGAAISLGFALPPMPAGRQNIYRGTGESVDYGWPIAMFEDGVTEYEIEQNLPAESATRYARKVMSDCGKESDASAETIVRIGADGEMLPPLPNEPYDLTLEPLAGGRLRLRWKYAAGGEEATVAGWKVYMAEENEEFDYDEPAATLAAGARSWTSGELVDGVTYKAIVRAFSQDENETRNDSCAIAAAVNHGPEGIGDTEARYIEVVE